MCKSFTTEIKKMLKKPMKKFEEAFNRNCQKIASRIERNFASFSFEYRN